LRPKIFQTGMPIASTYRIDTHRKIAYCYRISNIWKLELGKIWL